MHKLSRHLINRMIICLLLCLCLFLAGCEKETRPEKIGKLEYTLVAGSDIPQELKKLINDRKEKAFELTYSENSCLFIVRGYGKQKSGGYSIKVNDFYQAKDTLVLDTELFGPKKNQKVSDQPSYPFIVIKAEYREEPVTFY